MSMTINTGFLANASQGADAKKLRDVANESGLLMLEEAFTQQLQSLFDEENEENGGGYYRDFIPFLVQAAFKDSPEYGLGDEIYNELSKKLGAA